MLRGTSSSDPRHACRGGKSQRAAAAAAGRRIRRQPFHSCAFTSAARGLQGMLHNSVKVLEEVQALEQAYTGSRPCGVGISSDLPPFPSAVLRATQNSGKAGGKAARMRRRACRSQCAQPSCSAAEVEKGRRSVRCRSGWHKAAHCAPPSTDAKRAAHCCSVPSTCLAEQLCPQFLRFPGSWLVLGAGDLH